MYHSTKQFRLDSSLRCFFIAFESEKLDENFLFIAKVFFSRLSRYQNIWCSQSKGYCVKTFQSDSVVCRIKFDKLLSPWQTGINSFWGFLWDLSPWSFKFFMVTGQMWSFYLPVKKKCDDWERSCENIKQQK